MTRPRDTPRVATAAYRTVRAAIHDGDILLFSGRKPFSLLIRVLTRSRYSHAGIAAWWGERLMVMEAGVGGVHAARLLEAEAEACGFDVIDAGTSLADVAGMFGRYDRLILIDAVHGGGPPGAVYEMELHDPEELLCAQAPLSLHEMGVADALRQARLTGTLPRQVWLVGVEPCRVQWGIGLSPAVEAAMGKLLRRVRQLAAR